MKNKRIKIVLAQSMFQWVGRKVTGSYNETVDIKEGRFFMTNGKLAEKILGTEIQRLLTAVPSGS